MSWPAFGRAEVLVSSPTKLKKQEPRRGWNRAVKITVTHTVRLWAMRNTKNQSGYEPLNLENGSFLNSDNFDATDWNCWEIVQNPTVREYTSRCNSVENIHIHKVIGPWDRVIFVGETEAIIAELRRAAKRSPISIPYMGNKRKPMSWFSHGYHG